MADLTCFNELPERRGGDSVKWNRYAGRDVLPFWVADMDFRSPDCVVEALVQRARDGVFGYAEAGAEATAAVLAALRRDYGWEVAEEWLVWLPGLVSGLNICCRAVAGAEDEVLVSTPVYPPFLTAPGNGGSRALVVPLREQDGEWTWDWPAMAAAVTPRTRLLLLCHPHNPLGRVWSAAELRQLADFAAAHDLVLCSDEIHCGLLLDEGQHQPLAMLDAATAARTMTLMAASKTWNLAGLGCAFAIIANPELRRRFLRAKRDIVPHVNLFGYVATAAAYRDGEPWRLALLEYLRGNRERVLAALQGLAGLRVCRPQATYLAWIDCRASGLEQPAQFFEQAGVGVSDGAEFGAPGFVRFNFGCPRSMLDEALARMVAALGRWESNRA